MIVNGNLIQAASGCQLLRTSDNQLFGTELYLGKTFYLNGEYIPEGKQEYSEDYIDVMVLNIDDQDYPVIPTDKYETLVTELIRCKYSLDAELALVNNYQWYPDQYKDTYTEFQNWRSKCKEASKKALGIV